jgi:hypothetical protein
MCGLYVGWEQDTAPNPLSWQSKTDEEKGLAEAYETLFRLFYHIPWDQDEVSYSVCKCVDVAKLADQYLSLSVVAGALEDRLCTAPAVVISNMISYQAPRCSCPGNQDTFC